jgi:hypothetical protein
VKADELDTTEGMDSALKVIELIPRNQDQDAVWHSLEGSLCEHEDVAVMKTLGRFQARLPHDLAKAIDIKIVGFRPENTSRFTGPFPRAIGGTRVFPTSG